MKLLTNLWVRLMKVWTRLRYRHWTILESMAYILNKVALQFNIAPSFFEQLLKKTHNIFFSKWEVRTIDGKKYLDIKGVKVIDIDREVFDDSLSVFCYHGDNYDKDIVDFVNKHTQEGPYCYKDNDFDVTIKKNDVVFDCGSATGDFAAYAAYKGAISYAFEPTEDMFQLLLQTVSLNGGKIIPIQKGLSNFIGDALISLEGLSSSLVMHSGDKTEKIALTTLDKFVEENNLTRVDFIKADIEGAERDMLRGATNLLKTFAPKLSICTYHLPDDPEVLEKIILDANPNYTIVHLRQKLMAAVI